MRTKVIGYLHDKMTSTGGHCGTSLNELVNKLDIDLSDLKTLMNELHSKGMIEVKKGVHGKLIFYKINGSRLTKDSVNG